MFAFMEKFESRKESIILRSGLFYYMLFGSVLIMTFSIGIINSASAYVAVQDQISLTSEVFVIRIEKNSDGEEQEVLKKPSDVVVIPGDRLKFILSYRNETGQDVVGFKATNPMPSAVQFSEAAEGWAEISIDGGKNWGKLSNLSVQTTAIGSDTVVERVATAADVTHVRWVFTEVIVQNGSGTLSFEGVVK